MNVSAPVNGRSSRRWPSAGRRREASRIASVPSPLAARAATRVRRPAQEREQSRDEEHSAHRMQVSRAPYARNEELLGIRTGSAAWTEAGRLRDDRARRLGRRPPRAARVHKLSGRSPDSRAGALPPRGGAAPGRRPRHPQRRADRRRRADRDPLRRRHGHRLAALQERRAPIVSLGIVGTFATARSWPRARTTCSTSAGRRRGCSAPRSRPPTRR